MDRDFIDVKKAINKLMAKEKQLKRDLEKVQKEKIEIAVLLSNEITINEIIDKYSKGGKL